MWTIVLEQVSNHKAFAALSGYFVVSKTIWKIKTESPWIFSNLRRIIRLQENKNEKAVFRGGLPMKILRITAQGLPLFKKTWIFAFIRSNVFAKRTKIVFTV